MERWGDSRHPYMLAVPYSAHGALAEMFKNSNMGQRRLAHCPAAGPAHVCLTGEGIPESVKINRQLVRAVMIDLKGYDIETGGDEGEHSQGRDVAGRGVLEAERASLCDPRERGELLMEERRIIANRAKDAALDLLDSETREPIAAMANGLSAARCGASPAF